MKEEIKARISVVGNCQSEALAWYIRRLPQMREGAKNGKVVCNWLVAEKFREHMKRIYKGKFRNYLFLHANAKNRHRLVINNKIDHKYNLFESQRIRKTLQCSDYVIFQKIKPKTSELLNWQKVKIFADENAKLISISSFFHEKKDNKYLKEMIKRENELRISLKASELIKNNKKINSVDQPNHPNVFYFLDLVEKICEINGWEFFNEQEVERFIKLKFPFG
jgi:hypothetical protein